ncbi:hypothetical protein FRB94_001700 [Tulasnella sp. JGI-2019a]|nr:hypothetical protein FRB94_001700 [Tulasnella sp. JGI-2019a]
MAVSDNNLLCDPKSDGTGDGGAGVDQPRSIEHAAAAAAAEARLKMASKTGSLQVGSINSCAQKSSVFAALTLAWSITSVDQQLAFIDKLLPRDTKPLRRVLHFASIVLNPIAAAAECYLIFVTIPQSCVWWPSISISRKDAIAFLMDPQVLYQSRGFRLGVFSWASTGLYTKAGDYFRSAMFFLWIAGWISRLLGPTWIVLSALLCVSVLVHQQYNPGPTIIVL